MYPALRILSLFLLSVAAFLLLNLIVFLTLVATRTYTTAAPRDIPWAGLKGRKVLARLRASLEQVVAGKAPLYEGWEKWSKQGKPFIYPQWQGPEVVLPPTLEGKEVRWLVRQPESVLNIARVRDEALGLRCFFTRGGSDDAAAGRHDFSAVSRGLTRGLGRLSLSGQVEEVGRALEEELGGEEWRDVRLLEVLFRVVERGVGRAWFGVPLCRDEEGGCLKWSFRWVVVVGLAGVVYRQLIPGGLKGWLAPVVAVPVRVVEWMAVRRVVEVTRGRMEMGREEVGEEEREVDLLQFLIDSAARDEGKDGKAARMTPRAIAGKALLLYFFALPPLASTTLTTLTHILTLQPHLRSPLLTALRTEAASVLPRLSTDPSLIRTHTPVLDSVIRESLRLSPLFGKGLTREVVAPDGVTTPGGTYLPYGTRVSVPILPFHETNSADLAAAPGGVAAEFRPLRFYDAAQQQQGSGKQIPATQISDQYLAFGGGAHACPGRFFAVQTLKLVLGCLVMGYDLLPLKEGEEVKMVEVGDSGVPSAGTVVRIRRRRRRGQDGGSREDEEEGGEQDREKEE